MDGYLLIDGNNLAHKALHAYDSKTSEGRDTSVIFGFMEQFASVRRSFPGNLPLIVWDGGYRERLRLSKKAVRLGLVPSEYKANRSADKSDPMVASLYDQMPDLLRLLSLTDIPQIQKRGCEADDVIASYCKRLKGCGKHVLCYTADHDYYQLADEDVFIISRLAGAEDIMDADSFRERYGLEPPRWVDVGALMGDAGDNIHGVPGVGIKTATALVQEHGDYESVINACCSQFEALRAEYPDLETEADIARLRAMRDDDKNPYAGCFPGMPFTGVAMALESGKLKKIRRVLLQIAMYQDRSKLAYVLKKMNADLDVPELKLFHRMDELLFWAACERYELTQLKTWTKLFKNGGDIGD